MVLLLPTLASASTARAPDLVLLELDGDDIGGHRTAWARVPAGPGPWRVVVAFHGGGRADRGRVMDWRLRTARADDLLLVFPDGKPDGREGTAWVGPGHADGDLAERDLRFARALVEEVDRRWEIDRERVYAAGFSNGGYLTDLLWCRASDVFRGFLVVSVAMPEPFVPTCAPVPPRPLMYVVGTQDRKIPAQAQMSVADTVAFYKGRLGCADPPVDQAGLQVWTTCAPGARLAFRELPGWAHEWPAGDPRAQGFDAGRAFLELLAALPTIPPPYLPPPPEPAPAPEPAPGG